MDNLLFYPAMMALWFGAAYFRRQGRRRDLPLNHPRRQRARMLYYYLASFLCLAVFTTVEGNDGALGDVEFAGFCLWLAVLFFLRKRLPTDDQVKAYEAVYGKRPPPEPEPVAAGPAFDWEPPQWPREPPREYAPEPQPSPGVNPHPRGSAAWAMHELDVEGDATTGEVNAAYRRLIRMVHPDKGGDTEFAADLNLARKVLLEERSTTR